MSIKKDIYFRLCFFGVKYEILQIKQKTIILRINNIPNFRAFAKRVYEFFFLNVRFVVNKIHKY